MKCNTQNVSFDSYGFILSVCDIKISHHSQTLQEEKNTKAQEMIFIRKIFGYLVKLLISGLIFLTSVVYTILFNTPSVSAQTTLNNLTRGQVIQISPTTGTFMCAVGSTECRAGGAVAEPYKLMYTGTSTNGASYFVMLDTYCAWESSGCGMGEREWHRLSPGSPWNSNNALDIGGSRGDFTFLTQMENFYNSLPSTIGGLAKATAIPSRTFDMTGIPQVNGTGSITRAECNISTNATPYGNIGTTFVGTIGQTGGTCTMTSRVSLLSYEEWQGGLYARERIPTSGSIGHAFCQARFNAACDQPGTDLANNTAVTATNKFGSTDFKRPFGPWLRTTLARGDSWMYMSGVWRIATNTGSSSVASSGAVTSGGNGILPAFWLSSSITTTGTGAGTYTNPFIVISNNVPTITLTQPTGNPWRSNISGYTNITIAGNVTDPDNQTQTVQYSLNNGTWTACQTLAAGTGTRAYGSVNNFL